MAPRPVILVVDDEPHVLEVLHLILDEDYEVVDASDGLEALALVSSRDIDLVLLDLLIDGVDGITFLKELRKLQRHVPVIVVSGLHAASVVSTAMRLGAWDYITKPFGDDDILTTVLAALGSRSPSGKGASLRRQPCILLVACEANFASTVVVSLSQFAAVEAVVRPRDLERYLMRTRPDIAVLDTSGARSWHAELFSRLEAACWRRPIVLLGARDFNPVADSPFSPYSTIKHPISVVSLLEELHNHLPPHLAPLPHFSERVISIIEHVRHNFSTVGVQDIGQWVGRSSYNLSRTFHSETRMPLKRFVTQVRVEAAHQFLATTTEKIETVAALVGFHDASHLSRLFRKYTGTRPGDIRRPPKPDMFFA